VLPSIGLLQGFVDMYLYHVAEHVPNNANDYRQEYVLCKAYKCLHNDVICMIYLRMAGRLHTQIISIGFGLFVKLNRHGRPSEFLSQRD